MERFIVSARKYRPDSFENLIGQANIASTLKNSIVKGQLAHAYLFCGPRGVGKTTSARIFAKTINCLNPTQGMDPCGVCESCVSFAQGRSYCIHELDAASNNSVEDIRLLNEKVRIPPQIGKYSVYIIDEVHMLSSSAFNAFLKTLEEPPAHAVFILATTEKHKIIPTILSRCQTYDFNRISVEDIVKNLKDIASKENITASDEALHIMAQKADGAMRDALTIFDQMVAFCGTDIGYDDVIKNLNVLDYEYYLRITKMFFDGDFRGAVLLFDEILKKGFNPLHFMGGLSTHIRDLLFCKEESTMALPELSPALRDRYIQQATNCTFDFLYKALEITTSCEAGYKLSSNQRLHIEFALIKLARILLKEAEEPKPKSKEQPKQKPIEEAKPNPMKEPQPKAVEEPQPKAIEEPKPKAVEEPVQSQEEENEASVTTEESAPSQLTIDGVQERPNMMSIKNLRSKALQGDTKKGNTVLKEIGRDEFSHKDLVAAWEKLVEAERSLPRLASALAQNPPILKDGYQILFNVSNDLQKNWIEQHCLIRINNFLQTTLNNKKAHLKIEVTVDEPSKENKLYMPEEKAKFLLENNPELREMQKDLKLEIK